MYVEVVWNNGLNVRRGGMDYQFNIIVYRVIRLLMMYIWFYRAVYHEGLFLAIK